MLNTTDLIDVLSELNHHAAELNSQFEQLSDALDLPRPDSGAILDLAGIAVDAARDLDACARHLLRCAKAYDKASDAELEADGYAEDDPE